MFTAIFLLVFSGCAPKLASYQMGKLKTPRNLGLVSQRAYQEALHSKEKSEATLHSRTGVHYSNKCLKIEPQNIMCLYYNVLNRGLYIQNNFVNYQNSLSKMVQNCKTILEIDPNYQQGGCYRILGNIYSQGPAFSLNPHAITRDLDKSKAYLEKAVEVAPSYPLNHLFLARTLEKLEEKKEAQKELAQFDRMATPDLDKAYPEWKKVRDTLAQELQNNGR